MNGIFEKVRQEEQYRQLFAALCDGIAYRKELPHAVVGLCEGAGAAMLAALCSDYKQRMGAGALVIVPDERTAKRLTDALSVAGLEALYYPERDFSFYNITASHEFEQVRIGVLDRMARGDFDLVLTTPRALLQRTVPPQTLAARCVRLHAGDEISPAQLCEIATLAGYTRTECADAPGLFSARGGIFDLYGAGMDAPLRIEFFGDEIDTISAYDPITQRRTDPADELCLLPAREVVADTDARDRIRKALLTLSEKAQGSARDSLERELIDTSERAELRFADRFLDYIYDERACLLDYLSADALLVCTDKNALDEQLRALDWQEQQNIEALISEGMIDGAHAVYYAAKERLFARLFSAHGVLLSSFGGAYTGMELGGIYEFRTKQTVGYSDRYELLFEDVRGYLSLGYTVDLLCDGEAAARRMHGVLTEQSIPCALGSDGRDARAVLLLSAQPFSGFELSDIKYACLSLAENEIARVRRKKRMAQAKRKSKNERILSYADLAVGDYVVHANHGIGIYTGLQTLTVDGATRDFVKIKYAGKDVLYLPCDQLDMLSKYIGAHSEDGSLKLNRIGGAEWEKAKTRVKRAAKEMARELIALYAARTRLPGFAFAKDDEFQEEFEAAFPYEETEGQTIAATEIKADMEKSYPMDRLLCGDVGFGKTEVAMRAAFKAAMNNKQVAVLVPTTILAMQHYQTFSARMRGFPINVDLVCRFRSPRQQKATLERTEQGKVDILIGTHRLLSSDIKFRDLGLLIVDEEQRFGVAQKEKLKQLSRNVDVLTLTATPIPRTLNMAMSGIRDMSILEEAPGDRLPVQSYVLEYDDVIIADALRRELARDGQVFYLCNHIENIDRVISRITAMVPDARVAGAHGKMDREELSDIWKSLVDGEIDILVSTTIIESGIDLPRANTLIVENADCFGLSQLHQIRGRVGRSSRRAYAYFTFPKGKTLTEVATKRLGAIKEYTEFGSGFRIALRDLEIRGAGNVLGVEQHGHMDTVGYDLYMKLLSEAILEEQGGTVEKPLECTVAYGKSAYIPERYIRSTAQRIAAYRRIAEIASEQELGDVIDELIDRYGDLPNEVETLVRISLLRSCGARAYIERIEQEKGVFRLIPRAFDAGVWRTLEDRHGKRLIVVQGARPYVLFKPEREKNALSEAADLLTEYINERNSAS